jgi:GNAT superfamily N-acetyltransferase
VLGNLPDFAVSPDLAGTESFVEHSQPDAFRHRMNDPRFMYFSAVMSIPDPAAGSIEVAVNSQASDYTVGFLGMRDFSHLQHLFVESAYQGQGIASKLWKLALNICQLRGTRVFTVNASFKALPIYQAWGFKVASPVVIAAGIQSTPMQLSLA